jgi:hypothetical protein
MIQEYTRILKEQMRADINNYTDDLASGGCKNFDEYQKLCGVIRGLALAMQYVSALAEKVEKSNE